MQFLKPAETISVYGLIVESLKSAKVEWFPTKPEADAAFDKAVIDHAQCPGEVISSADIQVPKVATRADVTELVEDAMYGGDYVATRVHRNPMPTEGESSKIKVAVACRNASGCADMPVYTLDVTPSQYALGEHYDMAEACASKDGYEEPFVCFDLTESRALSAAVEALRDPRSSLSAH